MADDWVKEWRARVGDEEADRVSLRATSKGTKVHSLLEHYLNNELTELPELTLTERHAVTSLMPILNKRVDIIRGQEYTLFSSTLRMAGRMDLLANFDDELSIIDFKTSSKPKTDKDILSYFVQETIYARMIGEMFGLSVDKIVTLIAVDHDEPQVFIHDPRDYKKELREVRTKFFEMYGV